MLFSKNSINKFLVVAFVFLVSFSLFNFPAKAEKNEKIPKIDDALVNLDSISTAPSVSSSAQNVGTQNFDKSSPNVLFTSALERYQSSSNSKPHILSDSVLSVLEQTPKNLWNTQVVKLIISFDPSSLSLRRSLRYSYDATILSHLPVALVTTNLAEVYELSHLPGIRGIFLDRYYQFIDPSWKELDNNVLTYPSEAYIGARALLDLGITGAGTKIAIVDTGIDKYHSDLDDFDNDPSTNDPKVIAENSFIDFNDDGINDTDAMDEYGHGTHCAGIAAANGILKGVAPDAYLINARALDASGGAYVSWVVNAINWAVSQGADVISMSIGWMPGDIQPLLNDASNAAWDSGSIVVVAAGNNGPLHGTVSSPGMASRAITVGASDMFNYTTSWSSRGPSTNGLIDPDVIAPGANIFSTIPNNLYAVYSGTSMATPAVAGVAALLKSAFPSTDIDIIRSAIISTATDTGRDIFEQGAGLVNALAAYNYLSDPQVFAFPSFTESSPLCLSPNELLTYQLDLFVEQAYTSLALELSAELLPYVSVNFIDSPSSTGWIRAEVSVTMPYSHTSGTITLKNNTTILYELTLTLEPEEEANDAGSSTDAGETIHGAIPIELDVDYEGALVKGDSQDFYSFPVIEGNSYSLTLTNLLSDVDLILTDENGTVIDYSANYGDDYEVINFVALSSGNYFARVVPYFFGSYTIKISETDSFVSTNKVQVTGTYGDYGVDVDSDGLYNNLTIAVELEINEAGYYDFIYTVCQYRDDYASTKYSIASEWVNLYLDEGIQTVELSVDGGVIEQSNYNGAYILATLLIGDPQTWTILEYLRDVYITQTYTHSQFNQPKIRLTNLSYSQENIDDLGGPELFTVQFSMDIEVEGDLYIQFWIIDSQHQYGTYKVSLVTGPISTDLTFEFSGYNLYQIFRSDIVIAGIIISSWSMSFFIPIYESKPRADFSSYEPLFTCQISDDVRDTDSDGLYDQLVFDILVDSKISTSIDVYPASKIYSLSLERMFQTTTGGGYVPKEVDEGKNHLYFEISLLSAGAKQISGPFLIPKILISDYIYGIEIETPYVTSDYDASTFDTPTSYLSKYLGSEIVLTKDGGLAISLEIISKEETYATIYLSVSSYYSPTNSYFYYWNEYSENLHIGKNYISLIIPYEEFFWSKFTGDLIIDDLWITTYSEIDDVSDPILIPDIDYLDFSSLYDAYFYATYNFELVNNDSDELYEGLNLTLPIHINAVGNYEFSLSIHNYYSSSEEETITKYYNETGDFEITFFIPARTIVRVAHITNEFIFECVLQNLDTGWMDSFLDTSSIINVEDFDYILPLLFTAVENAEPFDDNSDYLYDGINVILQFEASSIGMYYIDLIFYTFLSTDQNSYAIDSITKSTQVEVSSLGLQVINVEILADDLIQTNYSLSFYGSTEFQVDLQSAIITDELGSYTLIINELLPGTFDITTFDVRPAISIKSVNIALEDNTGDSIADYLVVKVTYEVQKPINYAQIGLYLDFNYIDEDGTEGYIMYGTFLSLNTELGEDTVEFRVNLFNVFYKIPDEFELSVNIQVTDEQSELIFSYSSYKGTFSTILDDSSSTPTETSPTPTKTSFSIYLPLLGLLLLGLFWFKKRRI